ncbi:MAG: ATP synthase F1 subunit epsilon [Oscillospiraceae bacterium]|nr:ATP synthase F1 subunit epsilon [Oscillospiraceae bacterium]
MSTFHLQIVTPDGLFFDGMAESIFLRTIDGEIGILAGHTPLVTALGMGQAQVKVDGKIRKGACIGGMLSVTEKEVTVVATTFEWAEDIDIPRAERSMLRAQKVLENRNSHSLDEIRLAEARLKRALVRTSAGK